MITTSIGRSAFGASAAFVMLAGCGSGPQPPIATSSIPQGHANGIATPACPQVIGKPTCLALRVNGIQSLTPSGWLPSDLETRYNLPITKGSGQIVAIVDAYDNPNVASDLAAYRSEFGLGTPNFYKYNQEGQQGNYPGGSTGWGLEIDLDVDMVSAGCPKCTIYLIEANGADTSDLETAEAEAVTLGAHIVSNSWICYGSNSCVGQSYFDAPGVVYLAAGGDGGYSEIGAPAVLDSVVAVGGTQLAKKGSKYSETIWEGGGGCATGVTKPPWQHDPDCKYRTVNDISSEAGCSPGVAEYDSYGYGGWIQVCGTSASSPLNAAVFGLAGNASTISAPKNSWTLKKKQLKKDLHLIGGGGGSCGNYLCGDGRYRKYYSGPAGWGSPNGTGAY